MFMGRYILDIYLVLEDLIWWNVLDRNRNKLLYHSLSISIQYNSYNEYSLSKSHLKYKVLNPISKRSELETT